MRAEYEKATVVANAVRRRYEAFERGVDEGRLELAQAVGKILGCEEREEMRRRVEGVVERLQSPTGAYQGVAGDRGAVSDLAVGSQPPPSRKRSLSSLPTTTPLMSGKARQAMPTPVSMPRFLTKEPGSVSKRRRKWDLHDEFVRASPSRPP